jgi:hypothetical protein
MCNTRGQPELKHARMSSAATGHRCRRVDIGISIERGTGKAEWIERAFISENAPKAYGETECLSIAKTACETDFAHADDPWCAASRWRR